MTPTERVGQFVSALKFDDLPEHVVEKARVTLLHDITVGVAGHEKASVPMELARATAPGAVDAGARLLVDGTWVTVEAAAFANAALIHARAQDDTYLPGLTHVGCTALPAALSLADSLDSDGRDFVTALVAGYEAAAAIGDGWAEAATSRGLRATAVFGPIAAAAACARLLELNMKQTASALGLAASFAGGTNQTWVAGTGEWQFQPGVASRNGLTAALLASRGVTGAPDALEGSAGLYRSCTGYQEAADRVGEDIGRVWRMPAVTYKPFPICALLQLPVSTLLELLAEAPIPPGDVEHVALALPPAHAAYPGTDAKGPFTDVGATLMSAQYCLAVGLLRGGIRLADLTAFEDPAVLDLVRRIDVVPEPGLPRDGCRITIRTRSGAVREREAAASAETFNWGREETRSRARKLAAESPLGAADMDRLIDTILRVDSLPAADVVSATLAEAGAE